MAPQAVLSDIGRLIFLSPLVAKTGGVIRRPTAFKAALEGMMHHYAGSLREFGVKANAIAPAFIETDNMIAGDTLPENLPMVWLASLERLRWWRASCSIAPI